MNKFDKLTKPVIQGGMGVGISMGGLAGAVAKEGGMGVISTANIGFREEDFWSNPLEANKRALKAEIEKAREIAGGKGLIAINAMVATTQYAEMVQWACACGIDAVISGAGLPLELPELTKDYDVLLARPGDTLDSAWTSWKTVRQNLWTSWFARLYARPGMFRFSQREAFLMAAI